MRFVEWVLNLQIARDRGQTDEEDGDAFWSLEELEARVAAKAIMWPEPAE